MSPLSRETVGQGAPAPCPTRRREGKKVTGPSHALSASYGFTTLIRTKLLGPPGESACSAKI